MSATADEIADAIYKKMHQHIKTKEIKHTILVREGLWQSIVADTFTACAWVAIAYGAHKVAPNSDAMQFAGLFFALMFTISRTNKLKGNDKRYRNVTTRTAALECIDEWMPAKNARRMNLED